MLILDQTWVIAEGDQETVYVDFSDILSDGESIASVATPEEQDTDDLTLANERANTAAYTDPHRLDANGDNIEVAIGKAVLFEISGQLDETGRYIIKVQITTDATAPRTLVRGVPIEVA